jgi:transcriptional regulator with XRE-family HTH domain
MDHVKQRTGGPPTTFGRRIREAREARNMSGERLAEMAGVSASYVSLIETGARGRRPSKDVVLAFAQALRVPAAELLRDAGRDGDADEAAAAGGASFEQAVRRDPLLRSDQKRVLIDLYAVLTGRAR